MRVSQAQRELLAAVDQRAVEARSHVGAVLSEPWLPYTPLIPGAEGEPVAEEALPDPGASRGAVPSEDPQTP